MDVCKRRWFSCKGNCGFKGGNTTSTNKPASAPTTSQSFNPYLVQVTATVLNIRKGPGTNYAITGAIKNKGVYTIVEEKNGWGKLKSGVGWICLKYTKKK